jgi:hypothetical protein
MPHRTGCRQSDIKVMILFQILFRIIPERTKENTFQQAVCIDIGLEMKTSAFKVVHWPRLRLVRLDLTDISCGTDSMLIWCIVLVSLCFSVALP